MKTSFYFIVWIAIYPILGFLRNEWIDEHSFIVALLCVMALSWFLNRSMPQTIAYESKLHNAEIMNDVYNSNVDSFRKRLNRMAMIDFISALCFGVIFTLTLYLILIDVASGIFELFVFGILAASTLTRAVKFQKYSWQLRKNPDPQESVAILEEMELDYASYYEERQNSERDSIMPEAPRNFMAFQIFSLVAAVICTLLGILCIIFAVLEFMGEASFGTTSLGILLLLYGTLASYYGIRDCINSLNYFKLKSYIQQPSV